MNIKIFSLFLLMFGLSANKIFAQNPDVNIQKYIFSIRLNDQNNNIQASADISYKILHNPNTLVLDLEKIDASGKGLQVDSVLNKSEKLQFEQSPEKLTISVPDKSGHVLIYYHGIPKDGLIIGENQYGDRTFFGDNWPNRAHQWLPVVDHPSDKALLEWKITAPSKYQVIANGTLQEETNIDAENTFYHYKTSVEMPTKVMVIGVAEFAVQNLDEVQNIPLSSWVYPENKEQGFKAYDQADEILNFYISHIGPYPFSKLADVQSTTRFGGMENAGNIFYFEKSVNDPAATEFLMAHEIAHQWFGDSASETDWAHLWLSEGFATYFTDLYAENKYGKQKLDEKLKDEREKVLRFSRQAKTAVIDSTETNYMKLLNPNSYQKGAWVLHMLRRKIGDENFWKGIREYYKEYQYSNASSENLEEVFEQVTGKDLKSFFNEWLRQYGQPELKVEKTLNTKELQLTITQTQEAVFHFPLDVKVLYTDGSSEIKTVQIDKKQETFKLPLKKQLNNIELDPNVNLLFEEVSQ